MSSAARLIDLPEIPRLTDELAAAIGENERAQFLLDALCDVFWDSKPGQSASDELRVSARAARAARWRLQ